MRAPDWITPAVRRRLGWALAASVAGPWLLGEIAKSFHQAGLDNDSQRSQMLIDFIVIGGVVFALTMVCTYAIGCWIHAVLHGPRRDGDAFPVPPDEAMRDD